MVGMGMRAQGTGFDSNSESSALRMQEREHSTLILDGHCLTHYQSSNTQRRMMPIRLALQSRDHAPISNIRRCGQ